MVGVRQGRYLRHKDGLLLITSIIKNLELNTRFLSMRTSVLEYKTELPRSF
jgi:hypothetical protein